MSKKFFYFEFKSLDRPNNRMEVKGKVSGKLRQNNRNSQCEEQREKYIKKQKHEQSLRDIWDNIQGCNIHEIGVLEGEVGENGVGKNTELAMA